MRQERNTNRGNRKGKIGMDKNERLVGIFERQIKRRGLVDVSAAMIIAARRVCKHSRVDVTIDDDAVISSFDYDNKPAAEDE